jgi:micrococcal nuclease
MKLALAALVLAALAAPAAAQSLLVVDGDTVRRGVAVYRLIGFDAPETRLAKCPREKALGYAATLRLIYALAEARQLELKPINVRDKFGRELARLFVDGRDVVETMVGEGFARTHKGGRRRGWCET